MEAKGIVAASCPQWISVNDRLPEKNGEYLVCHMLKNGEQMVSIHFFRKNDRLGDMDSCSFTQSVTHWMPLPAPPKVETVAGRQKERGTMGVKVFVGKHTNEFQTENLEKKEKRLLRAYLATGIPPEGVAALKQHDEMLQREYELLKEQNNGLLRDLQFRTDQVNSLKERIATLTMETDIKT